MVREASESNLCSNEPRVNLRVLQVFSPTLTYTTMELQRAAFLLGQSDEVANVLHLLPWSTPQLMHFYFYFIYYSSLTN